MPNPRGQAPSQLRSPHGAASVHLDALRGIAAVGVCFSHLRDFFFQDYAKVPHHNPLVSVTYLATGLGHQWVIVFFVLSGYLVGGSVLRSFALDRWSWRSYLLNRITRLYIVLIPALVLGGLLDVAGIHLFGESGIYGGHAVTHELAFPVASRLNLPTLAGNYAFLQGIYVPTFGSNGPLWSLSYEFWYYIAFPFLVLTLWRRQSVPLRLVNGVLLIAVVLFMHLPIALLGLTWLMGVAIHYLPHLPAENALVRRLLMVAAVIACSGTLAWCKQTHNPIADYVLGVVVTCLIYVVLSCSRTPMPKAYNWTAHALSRSSYTLYLVHVPLLVFIAAWMAHARQLPNAQSELEGVAIFAVVMVYAQVVWFFFEKRTDAIRGWIKPWVMGSAARSSKSKPAETAAQV
jgi:peptidoglycan/LPS O-acetylase OafA/YrhL